MNRLELPAGLGRLHTLACSDVKTYFNPKTARLRAFKERQRKLKQLEQGEADFEAAPRALSRDWIDAACKKHTAILCLFLISGAERGAAADQVGARRQGPAEHCAVRSRPRRAGQAPRPRQRR